MRIERTERFVHQQELGFDRVGARQGNPLLDVRRHNFILTPHVAWASDGAMQFLADQLIDNIDAWAAGKPQNLVT